MISLQSITYRKYELDKKEDPALLELTKIVRWAPIGRNTAALILLLLTHTIVKLFAIAIDFSIFQKTNYYFSVMQLNRQIEIVQ
jgi:hypothetical protein